MRSWWPGLASVALSLVLCASLGVGPACAALAPGHLEALEGLAKTEGLPLSQARSMGQRLELSSLAVMDRASFVRRSSLVAYVVFRRLMPPVQEMMASARLPGGATQRVLIRRTDLDNYLGDRMNRASYEDRIGYATELPAVAMEASTPPNPAPFPAWQGPYAEAGARPDPSSSQPSPAATLWPSSGKAMVAFSYHLAPAPKAYDALGVEYGHPVLGVLDARMALMAYSKMTPVNAWSGMARPLDGLAINLDAMATTRQNPGPWGLALEGGLGLRWTQNSGAVGPLASSSLRMALLWQDLGLGLRYPLWHQNADPSASWELSLFYAMPFSSFGGW